MSSFLFTLVTFSQIEDGSVAPAFTATDLNGNTHTLQDYLDDGKTVILNISATWCGPCWSYKQTGALSDIYYAYGDQGSDEVVILYIEGDAQTGLDQLNGIGGGTVGDWVSTTPFPIIDSATIADQYEITYFPTVYRICPDGLVYEMGQLSSTAIESHINANCTGTLQGEDEHAQVSVDEINLCEDGVSTDFSVKVRNYGNSTITSVDFDVVTGGSTISVSENANISKFDEQTFVVSAALDSNLENSVNLSSINNTAPFSAALAATDLDLSIASSVGPEIEVHIYTDNYPSEIEWNIKDDSGNVVASGGPYQPGTDDQFGGGGPDALTTKIHNVTLPDNDGACYTIELLDSYGDGWSLTDGSITPGIEIFFNDESVFLKNAGDFGNSLELPSAIKYLESLSNPIFEAYEFKIYPNPTNGTLFLSANENFEYEIYNLQGKKILQGEVNSLSKQLDLSDFSSGVYLLKVDINEVSNTQKIILK